MLQCVSAQYGRIYLQCVLAQYGETFLCKSMLPLNCVQQSLCYSALQLNMVHYIILKNGILKSNSSIFPRSEGYITQYTP